MARVLGVRTASTVDTTASLARLDPSWGCGVHPLAGGWLVLMGAGLYVNRALSAGVENAPIQSDIDSLMTLSEAAGVVPAFEATPSTHLETVHLLRARGFAHDLARDVTLLTKPVAGTSPEGPDDVVIRPVRPEVDLRLWQETSATGWGHTTTQARRASDAFAAAINALDDEYLVVAFDAGDGRPVGCASLTLRGGVAILGGMSTVPAERRRGVQAALLRHRMNRAAEQGCNLAATTTARGSASERNLRRHGFTPRITIATYARLTHGR